jgi:two-component system, OmpR family, phosphate regulon sensor histidine kinase PhoR
LENVDLTMRDGQARTVETFMPVPIERTLQARLKPFAAGEMDGAVLMLTLQDVTALKRSERMQADFVANASHELRTPLTSLIGFIETLRGPARDDKAAQERFLSIMASQAARMARLVHDLLSLSRIEMEEHAAPVGRADVAAAIMHVTAVLDMKAIARNMRLRIDNACTATTFVRGDEDQLIQLFQNLIDNAIQYGREGTEVRVRISRQKPGVRVEPGGTPLPLREGGGDWLMACVIDQGEGIPREHLPRLTERFYRADAARSRAMGGTGLGLAIVQRIVNRHRGRLLIDSVVGKGSAFAVLLPAEPEATKRDAPDVIKS